MSYSWGIGEPQWLLNIVSTVGLTVYASRVRERVKEALGPLATPCWIWQGAVTGVRPAVPGRRGSSGGYGTLSVNGTTVRAHVLSYALAWGSAPRGVVLHACDNRRCVNPAHLSDGTQSQNLRESWERTRRVIGARLTEQGAALDSGS